MAHKPPVNPYEHFLAMGVKLLVPYGKAKEHHLLQCINCSHEWSATLVLISQSFKKHGTNSCPQCNESRRQARYAEKKQAFLAKLNDIPHIELLSEYDGTQNFRSKEATKVKFRNNLCGHEFESYPNYILNQKTDCPVCGLNERLAKMSERNEASRIYTDVTKSRDYVYLVASYTRKSYLQHKATINPNNLPIGVNGTPGAYQVDHIVSKAIGYQLGIPPELISHHTNLQMLPWEENLLYKDKFKGEIPEVLKEYFSESLVP